MTLPIFKQIRVKCGKDCTVSRFSRLENVILGDGVSVADEVQLKNVMIGNNTKIGRRVTLYSSNEGRPVWIGKQCWISYGVFGEATGGELLAEDYVVIAHNTTLLTSSGPGTQSPIMSHFYPTELGSVSIRAHCWVGAHCVILPKTALQEGVVLAANSTVTKGTYDSWSVYGGTPAKLIKRLDRDAVRRAKHTIIDL